MTRRASLFAVLVVLFFVACGGDDGGPAMPDAMPPDCRADGFECTADGDCCTGNCSEELGICAQEPGECLAGGSDCTVGPDCCSNACVDFECSNDQCTGDGDACSTNGQCCSGSCDNGTCTPLNTECGTSGNACDDSGDCCSSYCVDGVCDGSVSFCTQTGDVCSTDFECCGGLCLKGTDEDLGVCTIAPASGATQCLSAGEVCGGEYMGEALPECGGECCSRACLPYGPTNVLICQPPSGCKPTGELCQEDSDCCGGPGQIDNDPSDVECSKEAGAAIGRCTNGQSCSPAGAICKLETTSCNANTNCCAGNSETMDTCHLDNLGIPRCLGAEIDCTDPTQFEGDPCSTAADCCGLPCTPNPDGQLVCNGTCASEGEVCTTTADCCSGLPCILEPGASSGVCGDTPGCAEYGQACTVDGDCCNGIPCIGGVCMVDPG